MSDTVVQFATLMLLLLTRASLSAQHHGAPTPPAEKAANRFLTFLELPDRRREATRGLLALGKSSVPALIRGARHPSVEIALISMHLLRELGPLARPALLTLDDLARSKDQTIANAAVWARSRLRPTGVTLIAAYGESKVLEIDAAGKTIATVPKQSSAWDVERLINGNYLVTHYANNFVAEITPAGKEVWSFKKLKSPLDADRLPSGNTLICDTYGGRVIEVDPAGKIVWTCKEAKNPYDADRLPDGNTLICDYATGRVLEIGSAGKTAGKIVWQTKAVSPFGADRLTNGNTLITRFDGEVVEIDAKGKTVFTIKGLKQPNESRRLANGNTLVAEQDRLREFDRSGKVVRTTKLSGRPGTVHRY